MSSSVNNSSNVWTRCEERWEVEISDRRVIDKRRSRKFSAFGRRTSIRRSDFSACVLSNCTSEVEVELLEPIGEFVEIDSAQINFRSISTVTD